MESSVATSSLVQVRAWILQGPHSHLGLQLFEALESHNPEQGSDSKNQQRVRNVGERRRLRQVVEPNWRHFYAQSLMQFLGLDTLVSERIFFKHLSDRKHRSCTSADLQKFCRRFSPISDHTCFCFETVFESVRKSTAWS
jgi:hypothetical protein